LSKPIGLVLSGGGARGAYEAGVLLYIAEEMPELLDRIKVITGTSVGAINAVYLASRSFTPDAVRKLAAIWSGLEIDHLLSVSRGSTARFFGSGALRLLASRIPSPATGLLSVERIASLVSYATDWRGLHKAVRGGRFAAVAVAATDISTGHTHLFVEAERRAKPIW
jgi:NTE family protein